MRPSSEDILLPHLLEEGSSIYVFGEQRIFCPRYIASVVRVTDDLLELQLDPDDLSESKIRSGQQLLLGFAVFRRQMRFGATVTALAVHGRGLLAVSVPRKLEKWPQRGYVRAPLTVPCEVTLALPHTSETYELAGITADVSASGAKVCANSRLDGIDLSEAQGTISLKFPERDPIVTACRVVRQPPPAEDGAEGRSFAVQYQGLPEADEMQIQLLVLRATARRFLRVEASVQCRVEVRGADGSHSLHTGVTENISAGGLLIKLSEPVPVEPGDSVALELSLPTRYLAIAEAEVVRADHRAGQTRVALDFGRLPELDYQSLIRFVIGQLRGVADSAALDAHPRPGGFFPILSEE